MKTTGIIMSGEHPKLILDGTKTMTRRVIKPQPSKGAWNATAEHPSYGWFWKKLYQTWEGEEDFFKRLIQYCPYGQVGDRLRVRETHYRWGHWAKNGFSKTGKPKWTFRAESNEVYYLDNPPCAVQRNSFRGTAWYKRPSLFMPNWASRSMLEILEIRAERVQEITEKDVIKEGVLPSIFDIPDYKVGDTSQIGDISLLSGFKNLWDSLNAKRGYGWEFNPWVWVISFKETNDNL